MRPDQRLLAFLVLTFGAGFLGAPVSSLLSVYVDSQLRQPPTFTATLLAFQLGTTGVFALVGGVLADRVGQKRALLLGLGGLPLASTVFLLHSFWPLAVVVVGLGVTNALQTIGGQSYLLASSPRARLGGFSALYFLGSTLGGAAGNAAAGPVADHWGFVAIGLVGLVLSLLFLIAALRYLPETSAVRQGQSAGPGELARAYLALARVREVALVGVVRLLPTCLYGTTGLLIPLLIFRLSHSVAAASLYATVSLLVSMTAQQVVGRIVDRVGPFGPVRVLTVIVPIVALSTALSARSLPFLFVVGVGATAVLWSISTTIPPLVREVAPASAQGRALGLVHLLWSSGMLVGTLAGGALVLVNPALPFLVFACLNLLTVPAALALKRPRAEAAPVTGEGIA